jgi:hypothetical protein
MSKYILIYSGMYGKNICKNIVHNDIFIGEQT